MEDKRGQRKVEGEERRKGHSNLSHVQCLLFFVHISPSCDTLDTMHSNTLTCIATHMGGSHSVGLKPRLFVYKKNRIESLGLSQPSVMQWCTVVSQLF